MCFIELACSGRKIFSFCLLFFPNWGIPVLPTKLFWRLFLSIHSNPSSILRWAKSIITNFQWENNFPFLFFHLPNLMLKDPLGWRRWFTTSHGSPFQWLIILPANYLHISFLGWISELWFPPTGPCALPLLDKNKPIISRPLFLWETTTLHQTLSYNSFN